MDKPEAGRLVEDEAAGVLFVGRMSTIESSWRSVVVMARAVRLGSGGMEEQLDVGDLRVIGETMVGLC